MGTFSNIFKKLPVIKNYQRWRELGTYRASFLPFGSDIYKSELVRSCIRPIAEHTSKANCKCTDKRIENILNVRPNMYMNGKDFLYKVRTWLELKNTAFIYIERDDRNKVVGFYPIPYSRLEAIEYQNGLFIKFYFKGNDARELTVSWDDLIALRKDYNESDIVGDDNIAINNTLELINTVNQGVANAVKATANLRGILKSTQAMIDPEDVKEQKNKFVKDYLNLENEGGIASLDASQEFIPITMSPTVANYPQMKEFRENVYRYYGVNDSIIMSDYTEEQMDAFYESRIEPFLVAISLEMTRKVFTDRQQGFNNTIVYESNKIQFASLKTKISMFKEVVLYGGMTVNEWRLGCNMEPIEGGDELIMRKDAGKVSDTESEQKGDETDGEQSKE